MIRIRYAHLSAVGLAGAALFQLAAGAGKPQVSDLPRILVLQRGGIDNANITNDLAQALDGTNRVRCVVYSMSDPIFRAAAVDGLLGEYPRRPSIEEAKPIARMLKAEYLLAVDMNEKDGLLTGVSKLLKNGTEIWNHKTTISVKVNNEKDIAGGLQSVARTIATTLEFEPLKSLPKAGLPNTNVPKEGQQPVSGEVPAPAQNIKLNELLEKADAASKANDLRLAVLCLREAVDLAPFEIEPRKRLVKLYEAIGQTDMALNFSRASANALGSAAMLTESAKVLIRQTKYNEATETLNDAMMIEPNRPEIRVLFAEIALRQANPEKALEHLEAVIKLNPTAETYVLRAVCRALIGSTESVLIDIDRAKKLQPAEFAGQYGRVAEIVDSALMGEGQVLRDLFQRATLKRTSEEVSEGVVSQERLANACLALLKAVKPPEENQGSHEIRLLALILLQQTVGNLKTYVGTGNTESMSDARFSLGDCLKQFSLARETYLKERLSHAGLFETRR